MPNTLPQMCSALNSSSSDCSRFPYSYNYSSLLFQISIRPNTHTHTPVSEGLWQLYTEPDFINNWHLNTAVGNEFLMPAETLILNVLIIDYWWFSQQFHPFWGSVKTNIFISLNIPAKLLKTPSAEPSANFLPVSHWISHVEVILLHVSQLTVTIWCVEKAGLTGWFTISTFFNTDWIEHEWLELNGKHTRSWKGTERTWGLK